MLGWIESSHLHSKKEDDFSEGTKSLEESSFLQPTRTLTTLYLGHCARALRQSPLSEASRKLWCYRNGHPVTLLLERILMSLGYLVYRELDYKVNLGFYTCPTPPVLTMITILWKISVVPTLYSKNFVNEPWTSKASWVVIQDSYLQISVPSFPQCKTFLLFNVWPS